MSGPQRSIVLAAMDLAVTTDQGMLARAVRLATETRESELHVVTVVPTDGADVDTEQVARVLSTALVELRRRCLAGLRASGPSALPQIVLHVTCGEPSDEIVWLAAHLSAELIVLATHGRTGFKRLLLGSVAERVVRLAGCPVLVHREMSSALEGRFEIRPCCEDCANLRRETRGVRLRCPRHVACHSFSALGADPPVAR